MEKVSPNLAVHEIRKSIKRIRALLHFYNGYNKENQYAKFSAGLGHLNTYLAPLRESYVNLMIFERITAGTKLIPERKLKTVRDILTEKNKTIVTGKFYTEIRYKAIQDHINSLELQLKLTENDFPAPRQMMNQLMGSFFKSHSVYHRLDSLTDPELMHDLRKKMKRLWYQVDFLRFMHPRYFKMQSDRLNSITEQLGEDHDLFVFMKELQSLSVITDQNDLNVLFKLTELQQELIRNKLQPRLKQFFAETPEMFAEKIKNILNPD